MENDTVSVRLNRELYEKIVALADKEGREIKFLINKAIENYLIAKKEIKV